MKNHVRLGVLGKGTVRIRFEPVQPSRYIVNCAREEIIGTVHPDEILSSYQNCPDSPDIDENGKIKTPLDHEVFDGKHPWHLEKYPDIPNLHIIRHKPGERLGETLEFKDWFNFYLHFK